MLHPGIVDEDRDRPDLALDLGDGGGRRRMVGDVEDGDRRVGAVLAQLRRRLRQPARVAAVQHHPGAGGGEAAGDGEADAPARAGDEGDPAAEVEELGRTHHGSTGVPAAVSPVISASTSETVVRAGSTSSATTRPRRMMTMRSTTWNT